MNRITNKVMNRITDKVMNRIICYEIIYHRNLHHPQLTCRPTQGRPD
jgi:hypothetical protein